MCPLPPLQALRGGQGSRFTATTTATQTCSETRWDLFSLFFAPLRQLLAPMVCCCALSTASTPCSSPRKVQCSGSGAVALVPFSASSPTPKGGTLVWPLRLLPRPAGGGPPGRGLQWRRHLQRGVPRGPERAHDVPRVGAREGAAEDGGAVAQPLVSPHGERERCQGEGGRVRVGKREGEREG